MGYKGPSNNNKHFFVPLLTAFLSCFSTAGVFIFFFRNMPFLIHSYLHTCIWVHAHIHKIEFPQRITSVLMHQDFSFKHHAGKKKASLATSLSKAVMFANSIAQFTSTAVGKAVSSSSTGATQGLEKIVQVHIWKDSNNSHRN